MKITHCKTNHLTNPLGFDLGAKPVLTWNVEGTGSYAAARITVKRGAELVLDTGFSEQITGLGYALDLPLAPRTRYTWTVTVRSTNGEEEASGENWFETGKLGEPWAAQWLTCDSAEPRHPIFEKELPLAPGKQIKAARLYLCGLGLYEARLNGEKIGEEYLAPGCCDYNDRLPYRTYDITAALRRGGALAVTLGNGWYKGRFGFTRAAKGFYGDAWKLIAEVRVRYADGTEDCFGTDESWTVRRSDITFSNLYDGEHRDAALPELPAVPAAVCAPEQCPAAKLTERCSPPVTVYRKFTPTLLRTPAGETVFDIGQNLAGIFRLRVREPAGTVLRVQWGEELQDGNFYNGNLRTAKAEYVFISNGTEQVLEPKFTYYGGRYLKIEGLSAPEAADLTVLALTSEMEETGTLATGHELVNRLISNIGWGHRSNFVDVPTDCPQRDERMGWTGDAQVFAPAALYSADAYAFYRKYLRDMAAEQAARGGCVPNVVPAFGINECSSVWGDAAVILPWALYTFSGDKAILEEQFGSMCAWVDHVTAQDGTDCGWRRHFHFGDWLALDKPGAAPDNMRGGTDEGFLADVSYMHSAELLAKAAALLGRADAEEKYGTLAQKLRERIRQEYYSPTGRCCVPTQTGLLLTLRHHLADEARTAAALRKSLEDSGGKLLTGFVGTPLLCDTLSENGMADLAEKLLLNEEAPGWLYEVRMGATTVWERWNSLDEDGHFSSTGMNSLNHYAYGSILEWMYKHLAGLQPLEAGFAKAKIAPTPIWALRHLDCTYRSAAGDWRIAWEILDAEHLKISVTVPFGASAELILPNAAPETLADQTNPMFADVQNGVCFLAAGDYAVTYQTRTPLHRVLSTNSTAAELMANPAARAVLLRAMPQIAQLPPRMQGIPLRTLAAKTGGEAAVKGMDAIDALLANL